MAVRLRSILSLGLIISFAYPASRAAAEEILNYTYDERGRLAKVSRSGTVNNGVSACYSYDKADNRTNVTVATSDCSVQPAVILYAGQSITSSDGRFLLAMQTDGNLVLYGPDGAMWATATNGGSDRRMVMQADGHLVVYNGANQALWYSGTSGNPGARLALQSDGNLVIYSSSNAALWSTGTVYVPPAFAISDTSITEGGTLVFTVARSKATTATYSVNFATANNSASAGSDFTGSSGTLTFAPSQMSKTVNVSTIDDASVEGSETLFVNLSGATGGATISDAQGVGTINDNDAVGPSFSVNDVTVDQGVNATFTITKTGSTSSTITLDFATVDGSAVAGTHYVAKSGILSFGPSVSSLTVSVTTNYTGAFSNKVFYLNLSNASGGATFSDAQGQATIRREDMCTTCLQGSEEPPPEESQTSGDDK